MLISFYTSHQNELKPFIEQNNITADGLLSNFPMRQLYKEAKKKNYNIKHLNDISDITKVKLFILQKDWE